MLTVSAHADSDTLLESTVLTPVPVDPEDATLLVLGAGSVLYLLLNTPPEEPL